MIQADADARHIRRAVLAAHEALLRSLNARSRRAQLKNGRIVMGELLTILEVIPPDVAVIATPKKANEA
jgi:hypothetical protein